LDTFRPLFTNSMEAGELNIAIVGAGKIAFTLTGALLQNGMNVCCVISRNYEAAHMLAKEYSIKNFSTELKDISPKANIIILSVTDNAISDVAEKIASTNTDLKNKLFLHLSGSLNSGELISLKQKGAVTASFHIMQTFPSKIQMPLKDRYAAVEAEDAETAKVLFRLAERIGLKPFGISAEKKTYYHLASVIAVNFLSGNMFAAQKLFNKSGILLPSAEVLEPIIQTALNNIKETGAEKSLSGPVERHDLNTINKHLDVLKESVQKTGSDDIYNVLLVSYLAQSLFLVKTAEQKNGFSNSNKELNDILLNELKKLLNSL